MSFHNKGLGSYRDPYGVNSSPGKTGSSSKGHKEKKKGSSSSGGSGRTPGSNGGGKKSMPRDGFQEPCSRCHRPFSKEGWIRVNIGLNGFLNCWNCSGVGHILSVCAACDGEPVLQSSCPDCSGTGIESTMLRMCEVCEGSGLLLRLRVCEGDLLPLDGRGSKKHPNSTRPGEEPQPTIDVTCRQAEVMLRV